ncbi:MAG: hypothetical protein AAGC77_08120 [Pseudomonadota bacterium]
MTYSTPKSKLKSYAVLGSALLLSGVATAAAEESPEPKSALQEAIDSSKPIFNARIRYETVSQDGIALDADAVTYRLRAGFQTGSLWDTTALIEFDHIRDLEDDFNSTINGRTQFPVVADPNATELNRIQLVNKSLPDTTITLGRQRIKLDNDRFVGNVGWRQNEQTFDAVRVVNTSVDGLKLDVTYIDQVNRIFGDDSPMGRWDSESFLINANYKLPIDGVKANVTGFIYLLDFDSAPGASSQTFGVNAAASTSGFTLKGTYAAQSDYGAQPTDYSADYYTVEGSYANSGFVGKVGYEVLTGDGTIGFSTPLATLHAFNGWADVFLATPATGIEDLYGDISYTKKSLGPLDLLKVGVVYHSYSSESTSADYGSEVGVVGVAKMKKFTVLTKYTNYDSDGFATDRSKFWLQLDFAL